MSGESNCAESFGVDWFHLLWVGQVSHPWVGRVSGILVFTIPLFLGDLKIEISINIEFIRPECFSSAFFNPLFGGFQNHHSCTGIAFRRFDGSENGKKGPKSDGYLPTLFSSF